MLSAALLFGTLDFVKGTVMLVFAVALHLSREWLIKTLNKK
jgi:hypothetical protein